MVQVYLNHFTTYCISVYFDMFSKTMRDSARERCLHLNHFTANALEPFYFQTPQLTSLNAYHGTNILTPKPKLIWIMAFF
ncbi:unnamed protein product [Acanthoscelides obtectus]|uniref:Uncharacterized protein n=1 Tax=Acanthoscelides obtectus TaxID=200917 RepID=A0A9P0M0A1_ACAOB|nr:unnamed protein product [Acanthoscelides obtectus]CAK1674335.1 hypothetical protein AOBTE_LOCUS29595 [Acanthoscelides obtectus]